MASVLVADTSPAATFLIWRSLPAAPTETCIPVSEVAPAKLYVMLLIVVLFCSVASLSVIELLPRATEFAIDALALAPIATEFPPLAVVAVAIPLVSSLPAPIANAPEAVDFA